MLARFFSGARKNRSQDERALPRFNLQVRVSLVLENGAVVHGVIRDMSTRGLYLTTRDHPFGLVTGEEGDVGLEADNPIEGGQMRFPCEVVRVDRNGVALRFLIQTESQGENFYSEDFMAK
ncbi:MAG: PilZ domain-containing protein [Magnetococcales bacterium]|nr:PilZ domain-containing protein [Magnetococcales bacterium]